MIEDKLLILRFKQGRHEALRQIYDKYKVDLLRLAVVLQMDEVAVPRALFREILERIGRLRASPEFEVA